MPPVGLEPTHLTAQVPKTCMSTNFITGANKVSTFCMLFLQRAYKKYGVVSRIQNESLGLFSRYPFLLKKKIFQCITWNLSL